MPLGEASADGDGTGEAVFKGAAVGRGALGEARLEATGGRVCCAAGTAAAQLAARTATAIANTATKEAA